MFDHDKLTEKGEFIEMSFGMEWDYVPITRQYVHNFLGVSCGDMARAEKFSMAVSELLENAVKYSQSHSPYLFIHVSEDKKEIHGVVKNDSVPEKIAELQSLYDDIMEGTPMEAYVKQMKLAATRDDGKSQLGLARIRYEAGAEMQLKVEDNLVNIFLSHKI